MARFAAGALTILLVTISPVYFGHSLAHPHTPPLGIAMAIAVATDRRAYTIKEFCEAHRISRSALYALWREGIGPRFISIGIKKLITVEAAAAWRREREEAGKAAA
jgi:hypothetical protein